MIAKDGGNGGKKSGDRIRESLFCSISHDAAAQTKFRAGHPPRPAGSSGGGEHAARAFKVR